MQLQNICELIIDCEHKTAPTQASGYPSIRTPNIGRGRLILGDVNRVSHETYKQWTKRAVPQPGDLIMAREAPVGNVAMIPEGLQPCLGQRTLLIRPDRAKVEPSFLNYFLNGPHVQGLIHAKTNGATVAHLNMKDVRTMELPTLPPLPTQQRIASILSAYDDLIENCQRRINILETMARSLYREWFVHFRFPGHENHPFVASPLGEIPEGWEVKKLGDIIHAHIGGGWGRDLPDVDHTEPAWVIRGTDIPLARNTRIVSIPRRFHKVTTLHSRRLNAGDIVFEISGGSKGQPVGRTLLVTSELLTSFGGDVICASFCKRIQPKRKEYGSELLYLSFLEGYESGEIERYQVQSTGISNFKWSEYTASTDRVVPTDALRSEFHRRIAPIFSQVATLGQKMTNLIGARDLLLQHLLTGTRPL